MIARATVRHRNGSRARPRGLRIIRRASQKPTAVTPAFASEGVGALPAGSPLIPSVASVLVGHVLRDGELVLLILKPSRWYLPLTSISFVLGVCAALCAAQLAGARPMHFYIDAAIIIVASRLMWAMLSWMGRLYVLTDQRILHLSGVFHVDVFDCPLRKVERTRIVRSPGEKLLRLGTIEISPCDENRTGSSWRIVRRPRQVQEEIEAAIRKAKQAR